MRSMVCRLVRVEVPGRSHVKSENPPPFPTPIPQSDATTLAVRETERFIPIPNKRSSNGWSMSFSFGFCVDDEGKQVSDEISLATQNATRVGKDQQLPARELNFEDVVRSLQRLT